MNMLFVDMQQLLYPQRSPPASKEQGVTSSV